MDLYKHIDTHTKILFCFVFILTRGYACWFERERWREKTSERDTYIGCLLCAPQSGLEPETWNLGMCPEQESKPQSFGVPYNILTTELPSQGSEILFIHISIFPKVNFIQPLCQFQYLGYLWILSDYFPSWPQVSFSWFFLCLVILHYIPVTVAGKYISKIVDSIIYFWRLLNLVLAGNQVTLTLHITFVLLRLVLGFVTMCVFWFFCPSPLSSNVVLL